MATWRQIIFQNSISPIIEQFIFLHDHIISILSLIIILVRYFLICLIKAKLTIIKLKENHNLEILWTFLPGIVLVLIALPSLRLLYLSEETENNPINIKTIGHQWYWSYEYRNALFLEFDSFMTTPNIDKSFRLLETDNMLNLPTKTPIQIYTSSRDVLHSWTVPNLGVKADSTPGRLNIFNIQIRKSGTRFGQCSEICGTNHSFIPIIVNSLPLKTFKLWLKNNLFLRSFKALNFYFKEVKLFTLKKLINIKYNISLSS